MPTRPENIGKPPIENANIILEKPIGTIPKETPYNFPFKIEPPKYNGNIIDEQIKIEDQGILGEGKLFSLKISKKKAINKEILDLNVEFNKK